MNQHTGQWIGKKKDYLANGDPIFLHEQIPHKSLSAHLKAQLSTRCLVLEFKNYQNSDVMQKLPSVSCHRASRETTSLPAQFMTCNRYTFNNRCFINQKKEIHNCSHACKQMAINIFRFFPFPFVLVCCICLVALEYKEKELSEDNHDDKLLSYYMHLLEAER